MSGDFEKGIVVDPQGYFIAAIQWPAGTPAPKLNERATSGTRAPRAILLRDPYAIDKVNDQGRWDFTPIKTDDGHLVRAGTWELPTEERWLVVQRRDKPDLWVLTGKRTVWPERLPALPPGAKLVTQEPPSSTAQKPIWSDQAQEWLLPSRVHVCDADGNVLNTVASYVSDDIPLPEGGHAVAADVTGQDEREEVVTPHIGDRITRSAEVTIRSIPRYNRFPVEILEEVLIERNLAAQFTAFITERGYTIPQVRALGTISLNNRLLRQFVREQGFSIRQAYVALQREAESRARTRDQEKQELAAEE